MAQIFVRVHSPLFFCHFSSTFLQVRLLMQFTTFKSLFYTKCPDPSHFITSQLQSLHVECPNSDHFVTFQLQLDTLDVQILVILSLLNYDLVTLGVRILVMAPKFMCTCSRLVLLQLIFIVLDI